MFALFEHREDGLVSRKNFTHAMRHPDALMNLRSACHVMARKYGMVSLAFEGINLIAPLNKHQFQEACHQVLKLSPAHTGAIFNVLSHGRGSSVQLADLLDVLTTLEEQHHRFLVPLQPEDIRSDNTDMTPSVQRHSSASNFLPRLDLASVPAAASQTSPQSAHSGAVAETDRIRLPRVPQSARAVLIQPPTPANDASPRSDTEADRLKRVEEWKKHLPKGRALQMKLRQQASEDLDEAALEFVRQSLLLDKPSTAEERKQKSLSPDKPSTAEERRSRRRRKSPNSSLSPRRRKSPNSSLSLDKPSTAEDRKPRTR